ncbi:MAG TPA: hypothetical protein VMR19_00355 [Candidatus Saccharimonadales bacterium]|jgi:hypothetical protein|nr:hypothetical protein [Candidatus Saccharimonadales bacterium]
MEKDGNGGKYELYEELRKLAIISVELKEFEKAQKILSIMASNWPERVIARGKLASNMNIPDSKLDTTDSIP